jgi:LacI family transcriptional regulator
MASIVDVAREAKVSTATVSRVINRAPQVHGELVERVRKAIEITGYMPPEVRRKGRPRKSVDGLRTGVIAVVFPDSHATAIRTPLSARLIHGIEETLREMGLTMVVTGITEHGNLPPTLDKRLVDGLIIRSGFRDQKLATEVLRFPHVHMLESVESIGEQWDSIQDDNTVIGAMAFKYLHGCQVGSLTIINMIPVHAAFESRIRSFQAQAAKASLPVRVLSHPSQLTEMVEQLVTGQTRPYGIFVPGSDGEVTDVYHALEARGLKLGKDMEFICCVNDTHRLEALDRRLINIDIQAEAIGRAAVELLLWRLRHPSEPPRRVLIRPMYIPPIAPHVQIEH